MPAIRPLGALTGSGADADAAQAMLAAGAVKSAAPSYTDGTSNALSVDTAGNLRAVMATGLAGFTASASFTPAAAAYGAADIMDTAKQFSFTDRNGVLVPSGSLIRILSATMKIGITSVPGGQTSYALHLYTVTPPSAQADNDAWSLAAGDLASYVGKIVLGTPVDLGDALFVKTGYVDLDVRLAGTALFGRLVTDGAHTAAAVARQVSLDAVVL